MVLNMLQRLHIHCWLSWKRALYCSKDVWKAQWCSNPYKVSESFEPLFSSCLPFPRSLRSRFGRIVHWGCNLFCLRTKVCHPFSSIFTKIYNPFSSSPQIWKTLQSNIGSPLHGLSWTRWTDRVAGVISFAAHLPGIKAALQQLLALNPTAKTITDINSAIKYVSSSACILMSVILLKILAANE